jgi:cell division protein FtsB
MLNKLRHLLTNRYTLILLAFALWMAFFDQNNMMRQLKLSKELDVARQQEQFFENEITNDSLAVFQLQNDLKVVEKFGRENYNMKKDDETIFLIVRDTVKKQTDIQK